MSNRQINTNNRDIARALCSLHRTLLNRGHGYSDLRKTKKVVFYEVECIKGQRRILGERHYLVKWAGYSEKENTWEPAGKMWKDCKEAVKVWKNGPAKKFSKW